MQPRSLEQRVTVLEEQMQELRELPARVAGVELQILQLREEMQVGFFAIRDEMTGIRGEMHGIRDELRTEMLGMRDELLAEIRLGDQATRDFMRMLYEEHKTTLRTIGEGTKRRKR